MYVAVVQFNPKVGALRENAAKALAEIDALASSTYPPDLVVFPAYALTGCHVGGMRTHDAFSAECIDVLGEFIERAKLPTLIGTLFPRMRPDENFVCLPEIVYVNEGTGEPLRFSEVFERMAGDEVEQIPYFELAGEKVAVFLDELPFDDDNLDEFGVIVINMAKEYTSARDMLNASLEVDAVRDTAKKHKAWLVCANLAGAQDDVIFEGASLVVSPDGRTIAAAEPFAEQTMLVNLTASSEDVLVRPLLPYEADWKAIVACIRDYHQKNGFSDCLLGLSGGIDSSLTAALAQEALGSEHVHGVIMPGPFSSPESSEDAAELAAKLGISTVTLPIGELYDAFLEGFGRALGDPGSGLAQQNLQARLRTLQLMHLANSEGWLLLNTGNKSEAAMGYSTLYGDTAGALAPLGNTYKSDVFGMAEWRNEQSAVIPARVLAKEPSAELYPGQKDTDALPPYAVLDKVLKLHIDADMGTDQIMAYLRATDDDREISAELVLEVLDKVRAAEFKRRQEPMAPTLSGMDMTVDRRWPLTNGFKDKDRNLRTAPEVMEMLSGYYRHSGPRGFGLLEN